MPVLMRNFRACCGRRRRASKTDIDGLGVHGYAEVFLPPSFSDLKLDDGTKLEIHPVASAPVPNWTVENVEAPRRVFDTKKVRTVATIAGYEHPRCGP